MCKDIPSFLLETHNNNVKNLFVHFCLNSLNFILCRVYLPPQSSIELYTAFLNTVDIIVQKIYPNQIFLIIGDNQGQNLYAFAYFYWLVTFSAPQYKIEYSYIFFDIGPNFNFFKFYLAVNLISDDVITFLITIFF